MFKSFLVILFLLAPMGLEASTPSRPIPEKEEIFSPNRKWKFTCYVPKDNKYNSSGELNYEGKIIWKGTFPNFGQRPRYISVDNSGYVITFDEWDNVPSHYAIVTYELNGKYLSVLSLDDVVVKLSEALHKKITVKEVAESTDTTDHGWWLQEKPLQSDDGIIVKVLGLWMMISDHREIKFEVLNKQALQTK